jgi:hypothetical protein
LPQTVEQRRPLCRHGVPAVGLDLVAEPGATGRCMIAPVIVVDAIGIERRHMPRHAVERAI